MSLPRVDAVIVGSGAGGAIAAKELSTGGLRVVLLERGKAYRMQDADHDILLSQYYNSGQLGFGPEIKSNPRTFRLTPDHPARLVYANEGQYGTPYGGTGAAVGGGTVSFGAQSWRFVERDFKMKSFYGVPEGTTLEDWPITYHDLEPYYTQAEYEIGISGQGGANPFESPRSKPYPMPPLAYDRAGDILVRGARKLGLHPFPLPLAILSKDYDGRQACVYCVFCERFLCEVDAKSAMHVTMIPKALATGNCELRAECMAKEVLVDEHGRARGVVYFGPDKKLYEQPADLVVVSCSATESPRLLLNSKSKLFPTGLANRTDQVGRHVMHHVGGGGAIGFFEEETFEPYGPGFTAGVGDFVHAGGAVLGGGVITTNAEYRQPLSFARSCGWRLGAHPWGKTAKEFVRKYFRHAISVGSPGQGMPTETNRVDLDPNVRDARGIPVVRTTHRVHPMDIRSSHFLTTKCIELLRAAGTIEELLPRLPTEADLEWSLKNNNRGGLGEHQVGGCRMGDDPKGSVLNRYCQTHDVDNLFVVDGSCFPTIGGFNPVLTIQANAFRVSEYIVRQWKGGAFGHSG